jgi:hypothetical protein
MLLGALQPPKPAPGGPATVFLWGREQELLASCYGRQVVFDSAVNFWRRGGFEKPLKFRRFPYAYLTNSGEALQ